MILALHLFLLALFFAAAVWLIRRTINLYTAEERQQRLYAGEKPVRSKAAALGITAAAVLFLLAAALLLLRPSGGIACGMLLIPGLPLTVFGAAILLFSADLDSMLVGFALEQGGRFLGAQGLYLVTGTADTEGVLLPAVSVCMAAPSLLILWMLANLFRRRMGTADLNDAKGFGRKKPVLRAAVLFALASLAGLPLTPGYLTRSAVFGMLETGGRFGAGQETEALALFCSFAEWVFLVAGGLGIAGALKLYVCVFMERNPMYQPGYDAMRRRYAEAGMIRALALCMLALAVPAAAAHLGLFLAGRLGVLYTPAELKGTALACVIGLSVYAAVVRTVCIVPGQDGAKYVSRLPRLKRWSGRRGRKEKDHA